MNKKALVSSIIGTSLFAIGSIVTISHCRIKKIWCYKLGSRKERIFLSAIQYIDDSDHINYDVMLAPNKKALQYKLNNRLDLYGMNSKIVTGYDLLDLVYHI